MSVDRFDHSHLISLCIYHNNVRLALLDELIVQQNGKRDTFMVEGLWLDLFDKSINSS